MRATKKSERNGSSNLDAHGGHLLGHVDQKGHISKEFYHRSATIMCVFSVFPSPSLAFHALMSTCPFLPPPAALIYTCARRRPSHTPGS